MSRANCRILQGCSWDIRNSLANGWTCSFVLFPFAAMATWLVNFQWPHEPILYFLNEWLTIRKWKLRTAGYLQISQLVQKRHAQISRSDFQKQFQAFYYEHTCMGLLRMISRDDNITFSLVVRWAYLSQRSSSWPHASESPASSFLRLGQRGAPSLPSRRASGWIPPSPFRNETYVFATKSASSLEDLPNFAIAKPK